MAKQIIIERPNGTLTIVRSELETASEDPLTEHEQIINEQHIKIKKLTLFNSTRKALQLCPKCNGQGTVCKPPWIAGDVHEWTCSQTSFICDVCDGLKVI
jgi:uncharacterized protein with PIN domain